MKINNFLTNIHLSIDNLVEGKETLIPHVTQSFTPQEAIKQELKLRNLPPVDIAFRWKSNSLAGIYEQFLSQDS